MTPVLALVGKQTQTHTHATYASVHTLAHARAQPHKNAEKELQKALNVF